MKQGDYLRSLLKDKNIKTRYLYEKMNISKSSINFKINGQRQWKPSEIDILIDELNMSYEEIFKKNSIDIIKSGEVKIIIGEKFFVAPVSITRTIETILAENNIKERKVSNG
jgi:hypothetical protein